VGVVVAAGFFEADPFGNTSVSALSSGARDVLGMGQARFVKGIQGLSMKKSWGE
jgi:hypothetical protein